MTITKAHRAYYNAAKAVSILSDYPKVNIGAVVVYKHKIISSGYNSMRTHPIQGKLNKFRFDEDAPARLHAEVSALLPLINRKDIDFSRVSIYLYREYKNGNLAPSRCCESCISLIRQLGIRNIYYTNEGSYVHEELSY